MGSFCAYCGKPVVDGANFCVACGKPVVVAPASNDNASKLFTEPAQPINPQNTYSQVPQQIQQVSQTPVSQYQNVQYAQTNPVMQSQSVNASYQAPYVPNEINLVGLVFNYFFGGFSGRCRVLELWLTAFLILFLEILFIGVPCVAVFYIFRNNPEFLQYFQFSAYIIPPLLTLINFLPGIMISARRLHDLDMSGWMMLVFYIPIIGQLFMLYVLFVPGTNGHNSYG